LPSKNVNPKAHITENFQAFRNHTSIRYSAINLSHPVFLFNIAKIWLKNKAPQSL
jgi:hypothetical protein